MRGLIAVWVAVAVMFATPAPSGIVLIVDRRPNTGAASEPYSTDHARQLSMFRDIALRLGIEYRVWKTRGTLTPRLPVEYLRTGVIPRTLPVQSPSDPTDSVVAVIIMDFSGQVLVASEAFSPESLTLSSYLTSGGRNGLAVPVLGVFSHSGPGGFTEAVNSYIDRTGDTTGLSGWAQTSSGDAAFMFGKTFGSWQPPGGYTNGMLVNATPPAGGLRKLIGSSKYARSIYYGFGNYFCDWCDSVTTWGSDTVFMWERPMSHISGSAPIVFARISGNGWPVSDSGVVSGDPGYPPPAEVSYDMLVAGLARIDSLTGGEVFSRGKLPLRIAITIDDAFSYRRRRGPGGILRADSATFSATMDSLNSLGIPVTFGVNYDSMAAYPEWRRWLLKVNKARFAPQSRLGIRDSTGIVLGNSSPNQFYDPLGKLRKRALVGPGNMADTTYLSALQLGMCKVDSAFPGRLSRSLLPADDDYVPANISGRAGAHYDDSLMYAISRAGIRVVRFSNQFLHAHRGGSGRRYTDPIGIVRREGRYRNNIDGKYLLFAGQNGYNLIGGEGQAVVYNDSVGAVGDSGVIGVDNWMNARLMTGLFANQEDSWGNSDIQYSSYEQFAVTKTQADVYLDNILPKQEVYQYLVKMRAAHCPKFTCSDFSGVSPAINQLTGAPARNGYWAIKGLVAWARSVNALAGRSVIEFVYPEDLTEHDLNPAP